MTTNQLICYRLEFGAVYSDFGPHAAHVDEVAALVAFVAGQASYITGANRLSTAAPTHNRKFSQR